MPLSWEIPPCLRTFGMTVFFFFLCLPATHAQIAEGAGCTVGETGNVVQQAVAGGSVDLICNGSSWKLWRSIKDDGTVQAQMANDTGSCTAAKRGRLRYNDGTDTWQYCDNSNTWSTFPPTVDFTPTYLETGSNIECVGGPGAGDPENETSGVYIDVSCHRYHCCAVEVDGGVVCWGRNASGEATAPAINAIAIATSFESSCAIESDGDIVCWGNSGSGKTSPPSIKAKQISGGTGHYCAVATDNDVHCWGNDVDGQSSPPASQKALKVTGGYQHSIALELDGDLVHWGSTSAGEDGFSTSVDWRDVDSARAFSCGVDEDGAVDCWGSNTGGQVSGIPSGQTAMAVTGWYQSACALEADGTFTCWGDVSSTDGVDFDNFSNPEGITLLFAHRELACGLSVK